ncbi:MAG: SLBB domain-containing protein [Planctomycetota bacterium]|jgi:polysaccharide export outer membrane protein
MVSIQRLWVRLLFHGLLPALVVGCATPRVREVKPEGDPRRKPDAPSAITPTPPGKEGEPGVDLEALIEESSRLARPGFRFLPGDKIEINVFGYNDLRMQIRLPRDLKIGFPLIGDIDFKGRTIREVEGEITRRLETDHLHDAQVSVMPLEFAERSVFITGQIKKSGAYHIPPFGTLSLVQLLSLAGGFTDDADRDRILLIREPKGGERKKYSVSYNDIERRGKIDYDICLLPGDRVLIQPQQRVFVLGSVNHPGGFSIGAEGLTASKAVALAQGFTRLAAPNSTVVIREGADGRKTTFRVPISSILQAGNAELDLELRPGDVVYVPESLF